MTKGSRNLKSAALKMGEISSIQISTNARTATTATPRDRRNHWFYVSGVFYLKKKTFGPLEIRTRDRSEHFSA
jgi:hypothetical protein